MKSPAPSRQADYEDDESDYSDAASIHSDDEEDFADYRKGGYHPVNLGDRFKNGRYTVVRKLGWGHFSTVWLAWDNVDKRHVALKIVKSAPHFTQSALEEIKLLEAIKTTDPNAVGWQYVAQLLDHFWHKGPNGDHVCMAFEVLGESLLSLIKRYRYRGIPQHIVKRITKQILLGLDYLHRQCGIVHTDLKPENVLVWIPNVEEYLQKHAKDVKVPEQQQQPPTILKQTTQAPPSPPKLLAKNTAATNTPILSNVDTSNMSKSRKKRLKRKLKKQQQQQQQQQLEKQATYLQEEETHEYEQHQEQLSVANAGANGAANGSNSNNGLADKFNKMTLGSSKEDVEIIPTSILDFTEIWSESSTGDVDGSLVFDEIVVKIADLGNACWLDGNNKHIIQTRQYRSPEVIVGARWNDKADMWSMAVMVFELLTGEFLFDPQPGDRYNKDDDHLAQIIELMLRVPRSLLIEGEFSRDFFNRKGELKHIKRLRYRRLRDVLHDQFHMSPAEADALNEFLSPMLEVDVSRRASAHQVLQSKWLQDA